MVEIGGANHLWSVDLKGHGTPVIAGDRVYAWGYEGDGTEVREALVCLGAKTGKRIWILRFSDFISDIIYDRYAIGSPAIDPQSGNIYLMTTPGILFAASPEGKILWQHSMMEEFGRLTFPNGRTGSPIIDGNLVIVRGITSNWGRQGPARDRFYAFDKITGNLVWASTPGVRPTDSSFSTPVLEWRNGRRVLYAGTGCGNVIAIDARSGDPLWRFQLLHGGINSSVVLHGDTLIAIHGKENIDTTEVGRMIALPLGAAPKEGQKGPVVLPPDAEIWRNKLGIFTSSPTIADGVIYQVVHTGELHAVDAQSGKILWTRKLDLGQLHASPLYADGKLYILMRSGLFYILRPSRTGCEELSKVKLKGNALGSPSVWNGQIYVHTTSRLYCFGTGHSQRTLAGASGTEYKDTSSPTADARLHLVPSEVLLQPGERVLIGAWENGKAKQLPRAEWAKFVPPNAKVKAYLDADFDGNTIVAGSKISAGAYRAKVGKRFATIRGRVLPNPPYYEDFESFSLTEKHKTEDVAFAYPPLPWIGGRFKWEVRERDGNKMLAKTLDRVLFQRATTFIGHPDSSNYTIQADILTDGNRRRKGVVGVVNQRYIIVLKGNAQLLEINSNHDRVKVSVPFSWQPNQWVTIKSSVIANADGSGVVRAKAWPRGQAEPEAWTLEAPQEHVHQRGAPGIFGFGPQSKVRVYVDNIKIVANE